jgi:hypothetical protein
MVAEQRPTAVHAIMTIAAMTMAVSTKTCRAFMNMLAFRPGVTDSKRFLVRVSRMRRMSLGAQKPALSNIELLNGRVPIAFYLAGCFRFVCVRSVK